MGRRGACGEALLPPGGDLGWRAHTVARAAEKSGHFKDAYEVE